MRSLTSEPLKGLAFDLDFRRGELYERLTYLYIVEDGMIRNLVARYR
jgi:hypothetical protein